MINIGGMDLGGLDLRKLLSLSNELLARKSLREFVRQAWPLVEPAKPFLPNWHIDAISDHLQAVSEGKIRKLLINVPPGHAKSLIVSVLWPAWQWLNRPMWRGLFASYADELSIRDSVRCRALLETPWYQETFAPNWKLSGDQNVKSWFENTAKGVRLSLSVGGKGTGFRGDCIVVDDPLNAKEQFSENALDSCIFWWDQVMSSRLNDMATGAKVIIMQRLSERDLAAHVLSQGGYEHLNLPSEFEPDRRAKTSIGWSDPRKVVGELLFPGLFPEDVMDEIKRDLGPQGYAAQHQQRPSPAEGGILKRHWWRYWKYPGQSLPPVTVRGADGEMIDCLVIDIPGIHEIGQSWDCAFKDTKSSDYVVGQAWGRAGADRFLLEQDRGRKNLPATVDAVRDMTALLSDRFPELPDSHSKFIEDKANGPAVIQSLQHEIAGLLPVNPEGGKAARASAVSPQVASGNVYLPHPANAPWVKGFVEECASFPAGAHDDQMDAATQLLHQWKVGPSAMFPSFRISHRNEEPQQALHIYQEEPQSKPWWPRWVSATIGQDAAAHWWVREPSGIVRIYRELTMRDVTADEFGVKVAELSRPECASTRMVPIWMAEKAFEATAGKSVAASFYQGITRSLGEHKAFLFVHNDVERMLIEDPGKRLQAIESRLSKMPHGFLSVQKVRGDGGDKKNAGWDIVREMLKWLTSPLEAKPVSPDWAHARRLAASDIREYQAYISQFEEAPTTVAPILRISAECRALIQAMSGAARTKDEEERLAVSSGSFVLQSLRIGALASREQSGVQPMEEFVGARLDGMKPDASPISKHLAEVRAEGQWQQRNGSRPISFHRVRRGR